MKVPFQEPALQPRPSLEPTYLQDWGFNHHQQNFEEIMNFITSPPKSAHIQSREAILGDFIDEIFGVLYLTPG